MTVTVFLGHDEVGPKDSGLSQKEDIINPIPDLLLLLYLYNWSCSNRYHGIITIKRILKNKIKKKKHLISILSKENHTSLQQEGALTKQVFFLSGRKWSPKTWNSLAKITQLFCSRSLGKDKDKIKVPFILFHQNKNHVLLLFGSTSMEIITSKMNLQINLNSLVLFF